LIRSIKVALDVVFPQEPVMAITVRRGWKSLNLMRAKVTRICLRSQSKGVKNFMTRITDFSGGRKNNRLAIK